MALANLGLLLALLFDALSGVGEQGTVLLGQLLVGAAFQFARRRLDVAVIAVVVLTLVISTFDAVVGGGVSPGTVEAGALILLAGMVTYGSEARRAIVELPAIFFTILYSNAVTLPSTGTLVFTVLFWVCAALTSGVGLFLRVASAERDRSAAAARNAERMEMARELHDVVAHHVTGMVVQAQAGHLIARRDPERAEAMFAEIEAAGTEAMGSMRRLVASLRAGDEDALVSMDPRRELEELAATAEAAGYRVDLEIGELPPTLGSTVVRLTREALTNCRKHTPAGTAVSVEVDADSSSMTWTVVDDGPGRSGDARTGFGLVGLRERVEALGGSFSAGPVGGRGWKVAALIPLAATTDGERDGGVGPDEGGSRDHA